MNVFVFNFTLQDVVYSVANSSTGTLNCLKFNEKFQIKIKTNFLYKLIFMWQKELYNNQ